MDSDQSAGSSQKSSRQNSVDQSSRQNSLDSDSGTGPVPAVGAVRTKDVVHKCHSDPGGGRALVSAGAGAGTGAPPRPVRHRSTGGSARRCVLTLDGYSYVIGELLLFFTLKLHKRGSEASNFLRGNAIFVEKIFGR